MKVDHPYGHAEIHDHTIILKFHAEPPEHAPIQPLQIREDQIEKIERLRSALDTALDVYQDPDMFAGYGP